MSTLTPTRSPADPQIPPRMDLVSPRRKRRWPLVVLICLGSLVLVASAATLYSNAFRHDLLPMQTFDDGTGTFDVGGGADGWAGYREGAYLVHSDGVVAGGTAPLTRTAYALSFTADVTIVAGQGTVALICAGNYEGQVFIANTDGSLELHRGTPDGSWSTLAEAHVSPLETGRTYRFFISCLTPGALGSGRVSGAIDGNTVITGTDPGTAFPIYAAGLKAMGSPIDVRFDDVVGVLDQTAA